MSVQSWGALKTHGLRIAPQTSMMNAIVAVARKLAVIMHRLWVDESKFLIGKGTRVLEKHELTPPKTA